MESIITSETNSYQFTKTNVVIPYTYTQLRKSDLSDTIKRKFLEAVAASVLQYGCTTWTLTKHQKKKNFMVTYTRMLYAVLNKSWKQRLYGHLPPIS